MGYKEILLGDKNTRPDSTKVWAMDGAANTGVGWYDDFINKGPKENTTTKAKDVEEKEDSWFKKLINNFTNTAVSKAGNTPSQPNTYNYAKGNSAPHERSRGSATKGNSEPSAITAVNNMKNKENPTAYELEQAELKRQFDTLAKEKENGPSVDLSDRNLDGLVDNPYYSAEHGYVPPTTENTGGKVGNDDTGIANIIEEIKAQDTSGGSHGRTAPTTRAATDMAKLHGIDYNQDNIRNTLDDATKAKYANLDTEYARSLRDHYNMSARSADDLYKAINTGDRAATISGATGGTSLAEQLMAMQTSADATAAGGLELQQARTDLAREEGAEVAENASKALTMYNDLGINLATMSARELEALAETYAADIGYEATIKAAQLEKQAQEYAALQNRLGLENAAATSAAATRDASNANLRLLADPNYKAMRALDRAAEKNS